MTGDKKIKFEEDEFGMDVTITWFQPMAIFLLFFTTIWIGFLVFFYSMILGSGAPFFAALFPLIHVGVGVYLAYYTLCLFFNKTFIHLYDTELHVLHQPIPWIGGNKKFDKSEIIQLYVKEKQSNSKNGPRFKYILMAQLKSGGDKKLLNLDGLSSDQVQEIEHRLEQYMGIPNQPVAGEFIGRNRPAGGGVIQARKHHIVRFANPVFQSIFLAKAGERITYMGEKLTIAAITQFDWHDGNSDKVIQCITEANTEVAFFVNQSQAILKVYQTEKLPNYQLPAQSFNPESPVRTMSMKGQNFILDSSAMGNSFNTFSDGHTEANQWIFLSSDRKYMVRVVDQHGQITYYYGEQCEDHHFERPLDLNQSPDPREKSIRPNLRDEDLV